jgi:hypothetical protein
MVQVMMGGPQAARVYVMKAEQLVKGGPQRGAKWPPLLVRAVVGFVCLGKMVMRQAAGMMVV